MALSKTIVKNNGIITSYHKVTSVTISQESYLTSDDTNNVQLAVKLTSYLNEEYRQNEQPIETEMYYFSATSEEEASTSARKLAYEKLKTLSIWADATDC